MNNSESAASNPRTRGEFLLVALYRIALTAWVGATWTVGLLAAPLAFQVIEPRTLAGTFASHAFYWQSIVAFVCAAVMLGLHQHVERRLHLTKPILWTMLAMLVLAAAQQFVLAPLMAAVREELMAAPNDLVRQGLAEHFGLWHQVSTGCFFAQCLLGALLVVRTR